MANKIGSEVKSTIFGLMTLITQTLSKVSEEDLGRFVDLLISRRNNKILVMGMGRSGLVGRAFALRLLHLGFQVHILGDTLVPSIGEEDLIIAISGSGQTRLITTAVEAAKHVGATTIAITSFPDSQLAKLADICLIIKGRVLEEEESRRDYFARQILGLHEPLAPLGTLFEDSCVVLMDAVVSVLMDRLHLSESEMSMRHANIE